MLKKILCGATLLCAAGFTNAAVEEYSQVVNVQPTDFDVAVTLQKFDDMGGTRVLESVMFTIDGSIFGSARVESEDAVEQTLETTLSAELSLTDALMNTLVVTIPSVVNTFMASAYDGTLDFGGTSGITYDELTASATNSESYMDAATLAMFSGMGDADFTFDAKAASKAIGAGNITSSFRTEASGIVTIKYTYSEITTSVSAPSQVALLGLGLLGFAGMRKLRK